MENLIADQPISLREAGITEKMLQEWICEHPDALGFGNVSRIAAEKVLPGGGRLDLLLGDEDMRYELELQLGATDPSHIIRTIEYWDIERKRYPQYDHCAVIAAEEITGRFMNVIGLFNGTIPLIALKIHAVRAADGIHISFVRVLDRMTRGEEPAEPQQERGYWARKSPLLDIVDTVMDDCRDILLGYQLNYRQNYIGLARDGMVNNFLIFRPKQQVVRLMIYVPDSHPDLQMLREEAEQTALDCEYNARRNAFLVRLCSAADCQAGRALIRKLVGTAKTCRETDP